MSEMIRFIALAAALGLAAGMLLGGVALLLAAPAHAQEPAPPPPGRVWLGVTAVLLALGAWQLLGRWIYVLLAFLS